MDAYTAMMLFSEQVKRYVHIKVVVAPASLKEKGVHIRISMKKALSQSRRLGAKPVVKLRLAIEGTAESQTGLKQILNGIESLNEFLKRPINLEDETGSPIPNTRIIQNLSEDDSMLDNPDGTAVQDVLDERTIELYLS